MEKLNLEAVKATLPWKANGIYLEKNDKQVAAVCSNSEIAGVLAGCVNSYASMTDYDARRIGAYKRFVEAGYYLHIAISNAKIQVNNVETEFVEKAYHAFYDALKDLIDVEHLTFEKTEP